MLGDDLLKQLGRLTVNYAALEGMVNFLVMGFISPNPTVGLITSADSTMAWKLARLIAFANEILPPGDLQNELSEWTRVARQLQEQRNAIVHSGWLEPDADNNAVTRWRVTVKKGKLSMAQSDPVAAEDIGQLADACRNATRDHMGMVKELANNPNWHGLVTDGPLGD